MKFENAKCPNCNANIQLDSGKTEGFCLYCGNKLFVREAINYLKTQIEGSVEVKGIASIEQLKKNAETALNVGRYRDAIRQLKKAYTINPTDYQVSLGLLKAYMLGWQSATLETFAGYEAVIAYAPEETSEKLHRLVAEYDEISRTITEHESKIAKTNEEYMQYKRPSKPYEIGCGTILSLVIGVLFLFAGIGYLSNTSAKGYAWNGSVCVFIGVLCMMPFLIPILSRIGSEERERERIAGLEARRVSIVSPYEENLPKLKDEITIIRNEILSLH